MIKPIIAITLYRRPNYTAQLFDALSQCEGIAEIPVVISIDQDSKYAPDCEEVARLAEVWCSNNPNRNVIGTHDPRLGIDLNKLWVIPRAFECGNFMIFLEDDTIPSKDALRWFVEMGERYADNEDIFGIGGYNRLSREEFEAANPFEYRIERGFNAWGWATWRNRWDALFANNGAQYKADTGAEANGLFDSWLDKQKKGFVRPMVARIQSVGGEQGEHTPSPEWHREHEHNEWGAWNLIIPNGAFKCRADSIARSNTIHTLHLSSNGLGDSVCAYYAACGAADATNDQIVFHSRFPDWFERVAHPGVRIESHRDEGINVYGGPETYQKELALSNDRKQSYCDTIAQSVAIEKFAPAVPLQVDKVQRSRPIEAQPYVLISPFTAWHDRHWLPLHWARMAQQLAASGVQVVVAASGGELKRTEEIFGACPPQVSWHVGWPVNTLLDAILGAAVVIGNDSGIPHVGAMHGVPTVAIHSHLPHELIWSHTNVESVMPETACVGCRWGHGGGSKWAACCNKGCSALASVAPERVAEVVLRMMR